MARPLRIEFADAVYHVTLRGDRREAIYRDDEDRQRHLAVIAQAMDRFDAVAGSQRKPGSGLACCLCAVSHSFLRASWLGSA